MRGELLTASTAARSNPDTTSSPFIPAIAFILSIAALYLAREVLVPFALAVLLAFMLTPVVIRLERLRLGRGPSVGIAVVFSLCLAAGTGWVVANQLIGVVTELPSYSENIQAKLDSLQGGGTLKKAADSVRQVSQYLTAAPRSATLSPKKTPKTPAPPMPVEVVDHPPSALQSLGNMLGPLAAPLGTALIVVVFTIFILMKREDLRNRFISLVARRQLHTVTLLMDDAASRVSRYLLLEFSINATFACLLAAVLHLIGLPNALLWGVLAGMLRFLPYVGPMVGGSLPFLLAVLVFDGWTKPLLTVGFFVLLELITSNAIEPWLGAARTGISALAILVAAVFWGVLWGAPGLILSTPLTVCLVVLGRYVPQLEFLYVLLGDEPVLAPEAHFYQRLLAFDQPEAQSVADAFLKERSLIDLYDVVILPALSMAEQDRHNGALDDARAAYIVQSIGEIINLLADCCGEDPANVPTATPDVRLLCFPVADEADAVTAAMLSQVAERAAIPTICLPVAESPNEAVATIAQIGHREGDILCISALPPFALLKARSLSKQLQARFPDLQTLVGLWEFTGSTSAAERFGKAVNTTVVTTLGDALVQIQTFAESVRQAKEVATETV
jgi:predicted PurR-regulated permease PerM